MKPHDFKHNVLVFIRLSLLVMSKLIQVPQNHTVFCLIPCAVSVRNALLLKYCLPLTNATGTMQLFLVSLHMSSGKSRIGPIQLVREEQNPASFPMALLPQSNYKVKGHKCFFLIPESVRVTLHNC